MWDVYESGCSGGHTRVVVAAFEQCRILRIRSDICIICCRSLTYGHFEDGYNDLPFPHIDQMVGLTYLRLVKYPQEFPLSLDSLHNLKEYSFQDNMGPLPEIDISRAAELTKLTVKCRLEVVRSRHHVKPPQVIITHE